MAVQPYQLHHTSNHRPHPAMLANAKSPSGYTMETTKPVMTTNTGTGNSNKLLEANTFPSYHSGVDELVNHDHFSHTDGRGNPSPRPNFSSDNTVLRPPDGDQQVAVPGANVHPIPNGYGNSLPFMTSFLPYNESTVLRSPLFSSSSKNEIPPNFQLNQYNRMKSTHTQSLNEPNTSTYFDYAELPALDIRQRPIAANDPTLLAQPTSGHVRVNDDLDSRMPTTANCRPRQRQTHKPPVTVPSKRVDRNAGSEIMVGHAKGRKKALSPEQAAHAAAVRGLGACPACKKKKIKVSDQPYYSAIMALFNPP